MSCLVCPYHAAAQCCVWLPVSGRRTSAEASAPAAQSHSRCSPERHTMDLTTDNKSFGRSASLPSWQRMHSPASCASSCAIPTAVPYPRRQQRTSRADCDVFHNRVTLTFDLLTSGSKHAKQLLQSICVPSLVLIARAISLTKGELTSYCGTA